MTIRTWQPDTGATVRIDVEGGAVTNSGLPAARGVTYALGASFFVAITVVPAFYSILRPKVATALLTDDQRESVRLQKEREIQLGLRDEE